MNFAPLHDHVLLRKDKPDEVSRGGIILPPTSDPKSVKYCRAEVLAVGPGVWRDGHLVPPSLKPGDRVLAQSFGGVHIELDEDKLWVVAATDIMGVVS
jgi:chaperonin GroES